MRFSAVAPLVAFFAASALAEWEIVLYYDVNDCNANSDSFYRVYTSDKVLSWSHADCISWNKAMPNGVTCQQYTDGGAKGPLPCDEGKGHESALSMKIVRSDGLRCDPYAGDRCQSATVGGSENPQPRCLSYSESNEDISSFSCYDDGIAGRLKRRAPFSLVQSNSTWNSTGNSTWNSTWRRSI